MKNFWKELATPYSRSVRVVVAGSQLNTQWILNRLGVDNVTNFFNFHRLLLTSRTTKELQTAIKRGMSERMK